jgi:hypothetical protein
MLKNWNILHRHCRLILSPFSDRSSIHSSCQVIWYWQQYFDRLAGSGDSDNFNCGENLIDSAVSVICLAEPPPPPPPETATLSVCKEVTGGTGGGTFPADFTFTVTGNNPSPAQFTGDNSDGCVDVTIGPGEYTVSEVSPPLGGRTLTITIEGSCEQVGIRAIGVIQSGETQECRFTNSFGD